MSNLISVDSTQHQVQSVCVFQSDRAEVRRILAVELKAGQNEVTVENLPNGIYDDSIRVEGLGNAVIFDVIYSAPPSSSDAAQHKSPKHAEIHAIEAKIASLHSEKGILDDQARILEDYSKTLTAEKADIAKLTDFLGVYKERRQKIHASLQEVKDQLEVVEKEVEEKRKELRQDEQGKKRAVKITIVVLADADGKAELSMWYVVSGASWNPMYDLRATISTTSKESSSISLQYRASITQSTGEDWNDVDLTLSTASPQLGTEIPTLQPYKIGPPYVPQMKSVSLSRSRSRKKASIPQPSGQPQAMMMSYQPEAEMRLLDTSYYMAPMAQQVAATVEGATSSTFVIAGRSTIPSDSKHEQQTHKVSIAFIDLQAQLEWITVPRMQASAFLRCQVKNTSQYILLPGTTSVFMDNNFVCKSSLPSVSPQESFSTSLGVDPAIRVTYHNIQKKTKSSSGGLLASKFDITSYTQRITIKNTRSGTSVSPLYIKDQIPVSEDSDFKVNLLEPKDMGPPKERCEVQVASGVKARWAFHDAEGSEPAGKTGGVEEEGVIEWVCDVGVGKSVDVALSWDISAPVGQTWARR